MKTIFCLLRQRRTWHKLIFTVIVNSEYLKRIPSQKLRFLKVCIIPFQRDYVHATFKKLSVSFPMAEIREVITQPKCISQKRERETHRISLSVSAQVVSIAIFRTEQLAISSSKGAAKTLYGYQNCSIACKKYWVL